MVCLKQPCPLLLRTFFPYSNTPTFSFQPESPRLCLATLKGGFQTNLIDSRICPKSSKIQSQSSIRTNGVRPIGLKIVPPGNVRNVSSSASTTEIFPSKTSSIWRNWTGQKAKIPQAWSQKCLRSKIVQDLTGFHRLLCPLW